MEFYVHINKRAEEYNRACLDAMIMSNTRINTKIPGQAGYNSKLDHEKEIRRKANEYHTFSWLIKG